MRTHQNTTTIAALTLIASAGLAQDFNWDMPASGDWTNPANWTEMAVPNSTTHNAFISVLGTYTINIPSTINTLDLSITNPNATIFLESGDTHNIFGNLHNDALYQINPAGATGQTRLIFQNNTAISGAGTIRLSAFDNRAWLTANGGVTLENGADHTIAGFGRITGDITNNGLIDADVSGQTLDYSAGFPTNNNLMLASAGTLNLRFITVNQHPTTGVIRADGGLVQLESIIINDGTVEGLSTFVEIDDTNVFFNDVTTNGDVRVGAGRRLNINSTLNNLGTLGVNLGGVGAVTSLTAQSDTLITGTGDIQLDAFSNRAQITSDNDAVITNDTMHTIHGYGRIIADMVNDGDIIADVNEQSLIINSGAFTNNGLLAVDSNGFLDIVSSILTQSMSGTISAVDGQVRYDTSMVSAGTLTGTTGLHLVSGSSTFDQVTNEHDLLLSAGRILNISNSITNNGLFTVNQGNVGAVTTLNFLDSSSLTGSGILLLNGITNRAQITADPGMTVTNDAGHTIMGYGRIIANMVNDGDIIANVKTQDLIISSADFTNNGLLAADAGAFLDITSSNITQSGSGTIDVTDGEVRYDTSMLSGGTLTGTTGIHLVNGSSTFDMVTNEHDLTVSAGRILSISNTITNNGAITVNQGNVGAQTSLNFLDSTALTGSGNVLLNGITNRAQITAEPGMTVTNDTMHTIHGYGRITADFVNDGSIIADVSTQQLSIQSASAQNNNTMSASDGGILELAGTVITQSPSAQIESDNALVDISVATIIGGSLTSTNSGVVVVDGNSELNGVTNNADLTLNAGRILAVSNFLVNNDQITINQSNVGSQTSLMINGPLTISGTGSIDLNGLYNRAQLISFSGTDTLSNASGHTLTGTGRINTPFLNNGTLSIGSSVGEMDADAPVTMGPTGIMIAEVDNFNSADLLDSSSTFHAAGTLDIMLIDDFVPATAWIATIVTADGGVTGEFDTVNFPFVPTDERLENSVGYFDNEIRIGAICKSDVNFSGDIDFIDISQFLGDYGDGNLRADLNGDMELDFIDISLFIQSFTAGCP